MDGDRSPKFVPAAAGEVQPARELSGREAPAQVSLAWAVLAERCGSRHRHDCAMDLPFQLRAWFKVDADELLEHLLSDAAWHRAFDPASTLPNVALKVWDGRRYLYRKNAHTLSSRRLLDSIVASKGTLAADVAVNMWGNDAFGNDSTFLGSWHGTEPGFARLEVQGLVDSALSVSSLCVAIGSRFRIVSGLAWAERPMGVAPKWVADGDARWPPPTPRGIAGPGWTIMVSQHVHERLESSAARSMAYKVDEVTCGQVPCGAVWQLVAHPSEMDYGGRATWWTLFHSLGVAEGTLGAP